MSPIYIGELIRPTNELHFTEFLLGFDELLAAVGLDFSSWLLSLGREIWLLR